MVDVALLEAPSLLPPELLDETGLASIEANADRLLEERGIEIGDIELARELWRGTQARIAGNRVHLPRGLARDTVLHHVQRRFTQIGRTRGQDVVFGTGSRVAAPAYGPPSVEWHGTRRFGTTEDFVRVLRLVQASPSLRHAGGLVGDLDGCPPATRHLHQIGLSLKHCGKPLLGPAPNVAAYRDALELAWLTLGEAEGVALLNLVNANSPLRYRRGMFRALVETARLGQGLLLTSYNVPGLTAPVTLAGAVAQGLAELLFGAATAYRVNPRACVIGGIIPVPFSMSSMRPAYGQPLTLLAAYLGASLIRRLGMPCRVDGGPSSAKLADAQAGFEAGIGIRAAVDAGADIILHAAGWLDNGLLFGGEKFVADIQTLEREFGTEGQTEAEEPLDPHIAREIDAFVATRSKEILAKPELAAAYGAEA
jgi:trimethylamine---corrinoid protein Co-methyltransferase